jgi:hypothetical protein
MVDAALEPRLEGGACPHMAVLLHAPSELPNVLASFYALGAKRGGWLVHRSVQGESDSDRAMLAQAGLDVAVIEDAQSLVIAEFDPAEPPENSTGPWARGLENALERGFTGLWYSRFAVGPDRQQFASVLEFERAWESAFSGRPVVTLCPYIVGELDGPATLQRLAALSEMHSGVLIPGPDAGYRVVAA